MKKTILPISLLCAIAVLIAFSCRKTKETSGPKKSLNQLFSDLRSTPQNFSVQAGRDTAIFGAQGTMLRFYTISFKDASGNIITSGTVSLQLIEMYKPGEMIQNRATTSTTDGKPLISGGQVKITAVMNGVTVYANVYGIAFKQSAASSQPMTLYFGDNNNQDSVTLWTKADSARYRAFVASTVVNPTIITDPDLKNSPYYIFDSCSDFDFINCDHPFPGAAALVTIHIYRNSEVFLKWPENTNDDFNPDNTQIFMCFSEYRSVIRILANDPDYFMPPIGSSYKLVTITNRNGNFYYDETSGITSDIMNINVSPTPETRGDIIARMAGL